MVVWRSSLRNRDARCHSLPVDWRGATAENPQHRLSNGTTESLSSLALRRHDVVLACKSFGATDVRGIVQSAESLPEVGAFLGRAVHRFAEALRQVLE